MKQMKIEIRENKNHEWFVDSITPEIIGGKSRRVRKNISVCTTYDRALMEKEKYIIDNPENWYAGR